MPQRPFILIIVTLLLTFVSSMSAYGQSADEEGVVYFRLVDTQIDTEYLSNRQNLKLISTQQNIGRVQILQAQK